MLRKETPRLRKGTPSYEKEPQVTKRNTEVTKRNAEVTKRNTKLRKGTPRLRKGTPMLRKETPRLRKGTPRLRKGTPRLRKETPRLRKGTPRSGKENLARVQSTVEHAMDDFSQAGSSGKWPLKSACTTENSSSPGLSDTSFVEPCRAVISFDLCHMIFWLRIASTRELCNDFHEDDGKRNNQPQDWHEQPRLWWLNIHT